MGKTVVVTVVTVVVPRVVTNVKIVVTSRIATGVGKTTADNKSRK